MFGSSVDEKLGFAEAGTCMQM